MEGLKVNREIKFRVFDKPSGKVSEPFALFGEFTLLGAVFAWIDHVRGNSKRSGLESLNDLVILQYTGLKDKNDKELYDGDIYSQWGEVRKCDFEQTIYEKMNCLIFDGDFEIIGNVYENQELLKANK